MDDLLDRSAMALAGMIRRREVSPVELLEAHIAQIEAVNPALNAVIATRYEAARAEARVAEQRVMAAAEPQALPSLLGLPYTTKEYIMAEGMPLTAGVWSRRHVRADRDATTVRRLREAGAILVGITNVPEGGLWLETYNDVYGRTVNPWSLEHTSGGSSGGEGAIVATAGVAFGLGADVGGSIRIPAAFCGTVGHKPTGRLVPNTGFWPPAGDGNLSGYLVCGPLTRKVEDVMPILRALAGPDGHDVVVEPWSLGDPAEVELRDVTVYPVQSSGLVRVSEENRRAVHDAAAALRARGARVELLDAPRMKKAFPIWAAMMATGGGPHYADVLGDGAPISPARELVRLALGRSHHTLPALVIAGLEELMARVPSRVDAAVAEGHALRAELEEVLGPRGVLLHPPYSRPAPRHYRPMLTPFDFVCTGLFNVLELPSTVVPTGFSREGLPLAVQVIGRRGHDHLTVAVAAALEEDFGGWRRARPCWRVPERFVGPDSLISS
ncbi:amidase [Paraliomyxa miuraensis]|uniref:amidase n=1 Tax=Paraliomyxa miuraensis TaxID=376150 RepID=UPI0022583E68|nr:amidase [Paraliomyxa miuraensis]MCX4246445.1 amidase [Paraliomyxa miuraensis]